jgi:hypothetical protein
VFDADDNDILSGGRGDDFIHGKGGDDMIHGGRCDDVFMTGTSDDIVLGGKYAKTVAYDSEGIADIELEDMGNKVSKMTISYDDGTTKTDILNGVEYVVLSQNAADGSVNLTGDEPVINFEEGGALAHLNDSPSSTGQSGDGLCLSMNLSINM